MDVPFSDLQGKTLRSVRTVDDEEMIFTCDDGTRYRMYHFQSCCENVSIEEIVGNLNDLVGTPILLAEVATSNENPKVKGGVDYNGKSYEYSDESFTWTFYKLRTIKGSVDIRWYGSSNGYYGEGVDFELMEKGA